MCCRQLTYQAAHASAVQHSHDIACWIGQQQLDVISLQDAQQSLQPPDPSRVNVGHSAQVDDQEAQALCFADCRGLVVRILLLKDTWGDAVQQMSTECC